MNCITVSGNIGRDAETRALPDGTAVASFSVADSQGKDKDTIWWNCSIFGKRAQSLAPYLLKGGQVTVIGNVTERRWTDKDGAERKSMDVRVQDVALQGGKRDQGEAPAPAARKPAAAPAGGGGGFDDGGDEIPFSDPLKSRAACLAC
jgi:single-strand DNA-binding protein